MYAQVKLDETIDILTDYVDKYDKVSSGELYRHMLNKGHKKRRVQIALNMLIDEGRVVKKANLVDMRGFLVAVI